MGGGWGGLLLLILGSTEYMWTPGGAAGQSPRPPTAQAARGPALPRCGTIALCSALHRSDFVSSRNPTPTPTSTPVFNRTFNTWNQETLIAVYSRF